MTETELPPVVRGELQPWTDENPAGGPVLTALLADLLPARIGRALIAGPHDTGVLDLVARRGADLTVLVRSVGDAAALRDGYTVVNGALDGLAAENPAGYDVIIAADGLDRLLGPDSAALDWPERAALLRGLGAPGALVVIAVENAFSITGLLDRRPLKDRYGDDEWRPLHDDPRRPSSPAQAAEVLGEVDRSFAAYRVDGRTGVLVDSGALRRTRPGFPGACLALAGLAAEASGTPLLAPVTDAAEAAARAGLLDAVAPGWIVVLGPAGETHTAYTGALTADLGADGWRIGDRAVPDAENAETVLFRLAAAEDVPGFRACAAKLGELGGGAFFDEIHDFVAVPTGPEIPLAAAWFRFRDRLIGGRRRHPWPPWMADGDDLVKTWLAMSGVEPTAEILEAGRALAGPAEDRTGLRGALAGAAAAEQTINEQAGHIFGLERTMRFRDQQLRTREQQLRNLRDELRRLKSGRAVRAVSFVGRVTRLRDPKRLAGAVKRRAKAFLLR
ncbi:hypothetical protein GCM10010112_73810 [Actinoplanes lobatus]|uniref:Uncharacterized protein n=1 Tax=Actinoplanes lobatus TaxID=113568 RepID=A0A7W7H8S6_9ACTN|nr:hypothetical protein [Actinoplanes lobatus]MBB4745917.1 hypothetical protein [Actinoplanes lobatus]GGN89365.1 hypothetical protein GCM10010112_73810 [Actinoplanes lobatus]GIE43593.1 hypothetical protein Alo02nite_64910 [Actinoplanes lobatus]